MIGASLTGLVVVATTVGLVLVTYAIARRLLAQGDEDDDQVERKDMAASVIFRISALHGLILSLVFAQQMADYQALAADAVAEANALADLYFDIDRYGQAVAETRSALAEYTRLVLQEEWAQLGRAHELSPAAWLAWNDAYERVLDLVPGTPRQDALRDHMLGKFHLVAEMRDARANHGLRPINTMFWVAAIAGVVFVAIGYHTYRPTRHNITLLSVFGAFTGLIIFLIYAFSNPYAPPGALRPAMFERLLQTEFEGGAQVTGRVGG